MDCHRCIHLRYDGCPHGRCGHPCHPDVRFGPANRRKKRPYSKASCPDFEIRKKCANCRYWKRGRYFRDGETPAERGSCTLGLRFPDCGIWRLRTSRG